VSSIAVCFSHISFFAKIPSLWWLQRHGDTAVMIFFVLSGYVIAFVIETKERTAKQYFGSRVARLYSVLLIVLPFTFICDSVGQALDSEFYKHLSFSEFETAQHWTRYLSVLFFVHEFESIKFHGIPAGTNVSLWSLSYEAVYYIIVGLFVFNKKRISISISVLILIVAGVSISALFPVWILGYLIFIFGNRFKFSFFIAFGFFLFSGIGVLVIPWLEHYLSPPLKLGLNHFLGINSQKYILFEYITAIVFGIHLLSAKTVFSSKVQIPLIFKVSIRWLGTLTFPLYALHYPAMCLFSAISPWGKTTAIHFIFVSFFTLFLVIIITPMTELLRHFLRKLINV
jgi:peptidoglycan/LPS O-acetylase OafA/YrhL